MAALAFFLTGIFLLLAGLRIMKYGLERAAGFKMHSFIASFTGSSLSAFLTGTAVTALIQSSTAVTVLVIGFVNAGILNLVQAVGIILGANIGTCVTAQILSFNLSALALPSMALAAALLVTGKKKPSLKYTSQALFGFGLIFLGLETISDSFAFLRDSAMFAGIISSLSGSPCLAVLAGAVFTGLIHSSSTTTGVVMALSKQGLLDLETSIALVLGGNIGTCATAFLASIGGTATGKRVALAHILLNLGGVAMFMPFLHPFSVLVQFTDPHLPRQISNAQTIFNIACSLIVLPFTGHFARLLIALVRER
ncbi:MAG TPA: Na/Pi cotransporter family protein [Bacillota bacterium]|nr:Na/Pi cotransporter family protein [Bacillota bacterium]